MDITRTVSGESVLEYYSAISEEVHSDTESVGQEETARKELFIPIRPAAYSRTSSSKSVTIPSTTNTMTQSMPYELASPITPNKTTITRSVSQPAVGSRREQSHTRPKSEIAREEQRRRIQLINQAPTGRPPWWNTFQPDPTLPADQQLLPTVARKLALKRWMDEGRTEESFNDNWAIPPKLEFERPGTAMSTSSALSRRILGQSPLKRKSQMRLSGSATNFSRRSNLSTASPVSAGSQLSDHHVKLSTDRNTKRESKGSIRRRLDAERELQERAARAEQLAEQEVSSADTKKTRPVSGFDFDAEKGKTSKGCCIVM